MSQPPNSVNQKALPCKNLLELGDEFYDPVQAAHFPESRLRYWNGDLVQSLGWAEDFRQDSQKKQHFQEFKALPSSLPEPLALRYHGHQFQVYNPDLGDGRGFTFAQARWQGRLWDFGTKGSGTTPYSRRGDGRLTLKGAYRESLATEWLDAVGVSTSRTWSIFETGERLTRNDEPSPTRSAVLTRFSHSHVRIGSFQRLAFLQKKDAIERLLRYCARHLLTELNSAEDLDLLTAQFLKSVSHRLASLTAQWMIAGFVHGVLNTDNLNITGESFDYGPYRFLPHYDPGFTAAYFDQQGLYAYGRQPQMVLWGLHQLAESLRVVRPDLPANEILEDFGDVFSNHVLAMFCHKLNVDPAGDEAKAARLLREFFQFQEAQPTRFEQTFFDLFKRTDDEHFWTKSPQAPLYQNTDEGRTLIKTWASFSQRDPVRGGHPALHSPHPVTLLIDEIENIWKPIDEHDDWGLYNKKLEEIRSLRALMDLKSAKF